MGAGRSGAALRCCTTGFGVGGLREAFDGLEPPIPLPGDLGHGPAGLVEAVGMDSEKDLTTLLSAADQPRLFEHDQVLGDGLTGEGNLAGKPARARLTPLDEKVEHPTTRRVGDGRPQVIVRLGPHPPSVLPALAEHPGEPVEEVSPAIVVLVGIPLLVDVGPGELAEAALDDAEMGALPLANQPELDQK